MLNDVWDVLVVGGGPTGLTAALLMEKAGLKALVIESRSTPTGHPAGHVINPRSLEIWRQIDPELASDILNESAPVEDLRFIVWCTSLAGQELARIRTTPEDPQTLAQRLSLSPARHAHYPQSKLERQLWMRAEKLKNVEFIPNCTCTGLIQTDSEIIAKVNCEGTLREVRAKYCIAADGARSSLRRSAGIGMPGPLIMRVASIHFTANLDRLTRERPAVIYWIYNEHVVGPLIKHSDHEWILMTVLHPPQSPEDFYEVYWRKLIKEALGTSAVDIRVNAIGSWAMTAQVADAFSKGRIFLTGDAAHRFPPTGGYGINTGVQDVHNLVWKLREVIQERANPKFLDTYEQERRPVALSNCKRSIDNQHEMDLINESVAIRWTDLKKIHELMETSAFKALPKQWQLSLAKNTTELGLRKLKILGKTNEESLLLKSRLSAAADQQKAHFAGALGIDLGYKYDGPLVYPCPVAQNETSDSDLSYIPSTVPGGRLPHAWMKTNSGIQSSLDLLDYSSFQLWVFKNWEQSWADALDQNRPYLKSKIQFVVIGSSEQDPIYPIDSNWQKFIRLDPSGAILIRPDGHIVWRAQSIPVDPKQEIRKVIDLLNASMKNNAEAHA